MNQYFELLDNNDTVWWTTIGVIVAINVVAHFLWRGEE